MEKQNPIKAECNKCGQIAMILPSHHLRKHKVCGGKRTLTIIDIPSMAWTYGKSEKSPLFGFAPDGVTAIRFLRKEIRGDRSKHGVWRTA